MNNDIVSRRKYVEHIRSIAEDVGMRGDAFLAESMFSAADFCDDLISSISELEVRERIDRDFLNRHLVAYEKLRTSIIEIRSRIRELNLDQDEKIIKAFSIAEI